MDFLDREGAIQKMNRYGEASIPFFFMVDYLQGHNLVCRPQEVDPEGVLYNINGCTNAGNSGDIVGQEIDWQVYPENKIVYGKRFRKVQEHIRRGNSYLVNLACKTPVQTNLTLKDVFYRSVAPYRIWMKDRLVCSSPEIFVRIRHPYIYSYPMKGTRDASLPDAREELLADPKETAEHATITDLIRNDLSRIAGEVSVARYRYIDEIKTHSGRLLQMSSEIRGTLPEDWRKRLGDLLFALLPAGSITGAPKKKTMQIISEAEGMERDFYTGIAGYFDGRQLDSCVMIRFIEQQDGQLYYRSGGGITAQSNETDEYNEMIRKIYVPIC